MWKDENLYRLMDKVLWYCGVSQLKEIKRRCSALLRTMRIPPSADLCRNAGLRTLALSRTVRSKRFQLEWRYCGKDCNGCPHGPYIYVYWHEAGDVQERYLGGKISRIPPSLRSEFRALLLSKDRLQVARQLKFKGVRKWHLNQVGPGATTPKVMEHGPRDVDSH